MSFDPDDEEEMRNGGEDDGVVEGVGGRLGGRRGVGGCSWRVKTAEGNWGGLLNDDFRARDRSNSLAREMSRKEKGTYL